MMCFFLERHIRRKIVVTKGALTFSFFPFVFSYFNYTRPINLKALCFKLSHTTASLPLSWPYSCFFNSQSFVFTPRSFCNESETMLQFVQHVGDNSDKLNLILWSEMVLQKGGKHNSSHHHHHRLFGNWKSWFFTSVQIKQFSYH